MYASLRASTCICYIASRAFMVWTTIRPGIIKLAYINVAFCPRKWRSGPGWTFGWQHAAPGDDYLQNR